MTTIFTTKMLFSSGSSIVTLEEQGDSLKFGLSDGYSTSFSIEEAGLLIEALTELHGIMVRRNNASEGTGEEGNGEESRQNNAPPIPDGIILPPFNFDTPEKLNALVGRAVKLRSGDIGAVERVDLDCLTGKEEAICLDDGTWLYNNGQYWLTRKNTDFDIVEVLAK